MKKFLTTSALALTLAAQAHAQTALTGVDDVDDRIDDISDSVADDFAESADSERFSTNGVPQGLRGSAALQFAATNGNSDTGDLSASARLEYGVGEWSHSFGLAASFGEANGVRNQELFFGTYEGSRAFTDRVYAFGTGRFEFDGFSTTERDAFIGGGLGYRIYNTQTLAWRIQGGPGVRSLSFQDGTDETEGSVILSSRFFHAFSETVTFTNDTDFLFSDASTTITNDAGVNFRVSDNLSTRVSYRTEYESDPLPGFASADNTLGVSLVVGF